MNTLKTFVQKKFINTRSFEVFTDKISVKIKKVTEATEYTVPYEELGNQILIKRIPKTIPLIITLMPIALWCAYIYTVITTGLWDRDILTPAVLFSFLSLFLLAVVPKNLLYLIGGQKQIEFYRDEPNDETVDQFVQFVIETSNNYLKMKYGKIDQSLPIEPQLNSILWLKNKNIITESEFEELKIQLVGQKSEHNNFGFKN